MNGCKCFDPDDEDGVGIKKDREWVGLTDEEILEISGKMVAYSYVRFAKDIEAKLKEKNV